MEATVRPASAAWDAVMPAAGEHHHIARFPTVGGRSLLGVEMSLPDAFPAEINVAVVAFQRWQQDLVDRWNR